MAERLSIKFTQAADWAHYGTAMGLSYLAYGGLLYMAEGRGEVLQTAAIIGGIYAALSLPYVRQIPAAPSRLFVHALIARDRSPAPAEIQEMADDLCRKAGMDPVPVSVYKKGVKKNAFALVDRVYLGQKLVDTLDKDELKFVVAHEISHLRGRDAGKTYLTYPPYIHGLLAGFSVMIGGAKLAMAGNAAAGLTLIGAGFALYTCQTGLTNYASRVLERRADRNALQLTHDFAAAARTFNKLGGYTSMEKATMWERFTASHPQGEDRYDALKKSFNSIVAMGTVSKEDIEKQKEFTAKHAALKRLHQSVPPSADP